MVSIYIYIYICVSEFCRNESILFVFWFLLAVEHESYKLHTLSRLELRKILSQAAEEQWHQTRPWPLMRRWPSRKAVVVCSACSEASGNGELTGHSRARNYTVCLGERSSFSRARVRSAYASRSYCAYTLFGASLVRVSCPSQRIRLMFRFAQVALTSFRS